MYYYGVKCFMMSLIKKKKVRQMISKRVALRNLSREETAILISSTIKCCCSTFNDGEIIGDIRTRRSRKQNGCASFVRWPDETYYRQPATALPEGSTVNIGCIYVRKDGLEIKVDNIGKSHGPCLPGCLSLYLVDSLCPSV